MAGMLARSNTSPADSAVETYGACTELGDGGFIGADGREREAGARGIKRCIGSDAKQISMAGHRTAAHGH